MTPQNVTPEEEFIPNETADAIFSARAHVAIRAQAARQRENRDFSALEMLFFNYGKHLESRVTV